MTRERWARYYLLAGMMPVMLFLLILLLATGGFWMGIAMTKAHFIIALFILFGISFWLAAQLEIHPLPGYFACTILFLGSISLSSQFYDTTYDGQWYHQEANIRLADGWNPVETEVGKLTLDYYAKGPWINGAALYLITDKIESVKAYNYIWMCVAAFLGIGSLLVSTRIPHLLCIITGIGIAFAPLNLYQSMSFYIDGQLASWMVMAAAWIFVILARKQAGQSIRLASGGLALIVAGMLSIKFTAIPLIAILAVLMWGYMAYRGWGLSIKTTAVALLIGGAAGILVLSFQPYVTNLARQGHPLYPFNQSEIVEELMVLQRPESLKEVSRLEKLSVSLASAGMISTKADPVIKKPFRWSEWEMKQFRHPDPRLGGHGPWFSGVLLLSGIVLLIAIGTDRKTGLIALITSLGLLFSTLLISEPWWARFTPQLILVPVPAMIWAMNQQKWGQQAGGYLILAAMLFNSGLVANAYYPHRRQISNKIEIQLSELQTTSDSIYVTVQHKHGLSVKTRLAEHDIPYTAVGKAKELPCPKPHSLIGCVGQYCLMPADTLQAE